MRWKFRPRLYQPVRLSTTYDWVDNARGNVEQPYRLYALYSGLRTDINTYQYYKRMAFTRSCVV